MTTQPTPHQLVKELGELLVIPASYYERAADRYRSLGEWLHRDDSKVIQFKPEVYVQGSFRYGTVNRPLLETEEYDLDLVCELQIPKSQKTQKEVKRLLGEEIKAYAKRFSIEAPVDEGNRCWRLDYADDVNFHMDILPCVPEDRRVVEEIVARGVPRHLAETSVAITDRRERRYAEICPDWPMSNPRGMGTWFEEAARPGGRGRARGLVEQKVYASIDQVPPYEWKTPLQLAIQILKRHRDVMFKDDTEFAPISMIITTLAAKAYEGESDLYDALKGIIDRMERHVHPSHPRIPNPVNPGEDFTDRWKRDQRYEENFWVWLHAARVDVAKFPDLLKGGRLAENVRKTLRLDLTAEQLNRLNSTAASVSAPAVMKAAPAIQIASAPKPWRCDA